MIRVNRILIVLLAIGLVVGGCSPVAPPHPRVAPSPPEQILYLGTWQSIGNMGIYDHMASMATSENPPFPVEINAYTSTHATLRELSATPAVHEKIGNGTWDVVVLQEESAMPDGYADHIRVFDELIRATGAVPVLFMPWEAKYDGAIPVAEIAHQHAEIASELDIAVAPVGLAWERAIQERPEIDLFDGLELASIYGTYLSASILYATLFGRDPNEMAYMPVDLLPADRGGMPALDKAFEEWSKMTQEEADFLQRIAWETVQDYQAEHGVTQ